MDEARWRRLQALFAQAVDLAAAARAEFITAACGTGTAMAEALRGLLDADAHTTAAMGQDHVPGAVSRAAARWAC